MDLLGGTTGGYRFFHTKQSLFAATHFLQITSGGDTSSWGMNMDDLPFTGYG